MSFPTPDHVLPSGAPARINGPALLMSCRKDYVGSNDHMLTVPMQDYDEVTLQAVWQMADPTHEAQLAVFQTLDWDASKANWNRIDFLLPGMSDWTVANQIMIKIPNIRCACIGIMLMVRTSSGPVPPNTARFDGQISGIFAGHRIPQLVKVYGSGDGPAVLVIGEEGREEFLAELLGVPPESVRSGYGTS